MSHLKAPNGKPSNLTPEQWKLVRTPQFKAWFGDWENDPENASKVVDENGEPLVVYHASPKKFNVFQKQEKAYFFSKNKGNAEYFVTSFKNKKGVESIEVYSVFLNIKNLFNGEKLTSEEKEKIKKYIDTLDNKQDLLFGQDWDDIKNDVQPNSDYQLVLDILQNLHLDSWHLIESNAFQKWLKDENYGGFIVYESGFNEENYGLFNSKDIKLADGSNTTFDGNNPDIRFAEGGTTKNELKAPNGKPSNLTPEQWKLVRTPQFKAWFGDWQNDPENASKVIDENGEPLVVYHGTNVENPFDIFDFNKADLGFHFGTYEQAKNRSETKLFFKNRKSVVNSFFLNIQNIYEMSDIGEWEYPPRYIDMLVSDGLITESDAKKNGFYRLFQREDNIQIREYLFAKYGKFIGFIYNNKYEGVGKSFIVLNPEQIKLADGSNTTFDGNNPDIRFAEGGEIDKSSIKEFADSVEAYQSNHYGSFNRDELVEKYLNLPNSIKQKIAPRSAKNLFRGADSFISKKSAISFTKNKDYANFFGAYTIPFSAIRTHEGLIDTKKLGNLLYSLKINNEVGDDEGEVIVIKPIFFEELSFDNPNIEQYRNEKFSEGGTTTNELKAPNGKPSNLTPEQWKLVRTAKFKAWFGDWENDPTNASKVVDENGEPLVVYHGTYSKFNIFDKDELGMSQGRYSANMYGFYFSNNKTIGQSFGKYLKECFIKIKKPITIDLQGKDYSQSRLIVNDFVEKITSKNDGAILFNYKDSGDNKPMISNQYIVSDSNRIKLADGSNTTFDGNNPDIRFAEGGTMKNQLLAPNGKPSNLTPKQWKLVRTPQFKEWFGDWENDRQNSGKVSGITKEPSIWYHSTKSDFLSKKGENIFKNPPFFFALSREVSENIVDLQHYSYTKKRITTKPFFVRYKNPFDITKIDILSDKKLTSLIKKHTFNDTIEKIKSFQIKLGLPNQSKNTWSLTESPEIQEYILSQGYDSFFVYEDGYKNLGVFDTEQIKLADGSNTTFDGKNSDIRFAEGGTMNTIQEGDALIYKDSEFLDFDNVIYVQNTEETANGTLISLSNGQTMFLTEVSKKFRKATQSEINRSEIMSKEIFEKGGKIRRIKRKKLFQPKDLSKITNFKNIYRGAEYYSLSENSEKQIASDRWFELFLKNQKESKLTKDEFSEFIKLSKEIVWEEFKQGGETKRTMKRIKRGGITYGKSHAEGGIPVKNQSTGDMLEVEGGEGIVNKRSMASDKKVTLNGKEMTICEAVSQLNQLEGGVQFSCDDVSDQQFIEAMAKGGELERGIRTEQEHIKVLKDLYAKRITPKQASKRIASDHLKEDSRYYSKLAKMEGQMADGGKVSEKQLLIDYQNEFLTNKFSTNLDKLHKSSEFPYVINQRLKMAKSYA